ncbi:MAG: ATPase domain-containing protein [Planctomycetaceae bacterium]
MTESNRLSTGISRLDELLGGGLLPGTLTVVMGATGIGKTQLGLQFANQGKEQEGESGVLFDMTTRGDSQNHQDYATRLFDWTLTVRDSGINFDPDNIWNREQARADYCHFFRRDGRRVTFGDLDPDSWREWKTELARKLEQAIAFMYGNFVHGVRRCVIDGIEPAEQESDSFQMHVFDYVYHQILRKEHDWLARDLFRVRYRANESIVQKHEYDHREIGCLLLQTTHEVMLEDMIGRPISSGDVLSNANTIIQMGKIREGNQIRRALYVAKHRGSACSEDIVPFEITETGLVLKG